jgi:hypothetical protein
MIVDGIYAGILQEIFIFTRNNNFAIAQVLILLHGKRIIECLRFLPSTQRTTVSG